MFIKWLHHTWGVDSNHDGFKGLSGNDNIAFLFYIALHIRIGSGFVSDATFDISDWGWSELAYFLFLRHCVLTQNLEKSQS